MGTSSKAAYGARKAESKARRLERRKEVRAQKKAGTFVPIAPKTLDDRLLYQDEKIDESNIEDQEVIEVERADEFGDYYRGERAPKLLITTSKKIGNPMIKFLKEIVCCFPNSHYYPRLEFHMKEIIEAAKEKEYTDVLVFTAKKNAPYGLYITHLPEGPTMYYRLTGVVLGQDIPNSVNLTTHNPELILKNFSTRTGRRMARQLQALFPFDSEYDGRRVVVFQNHRDFIFFRQYRYIFENSGKKARLAEIGPRFTLKIRTIQEGLFDREGGKFEFVWRPDLQVDRSHVFV